MKIVERKILKIREVEPKKSSFEKSRQVTKYRYTILIKQPFNNQYYANILYIMCILYCAKFASLHLRNRTKGQGN